MYPPLTTPTDAPWPGHHPLLPGWLRSPPHYLPASVLIPTRNPLHLPHSSGGIPSEPKPGHFTLLCSKHCHVSQCAQNRSRSPYKAHKALRGRPLLPSLTRLSPLLPSLTWLQPRWLSCCSWNTPGTLQPQGLCAGCSPLLEHPTPTYILISFLHFFQVSA